MLYRALDTGKVGKLRQFINWHRASLTNQTSEESPEEDWEEELCEEENVRQYADLALTRYYDLTENQGLGEGFDALDAYLGTVPALRAHVTTNQNRLTTFRKHSTSSWTFTKQSPRPSQVFSPWISTTRAWRIGDARARTVCAGMAATSIGAWPT